LTILMADDDEDDVFLTRKALQAGGGRDVLRRVRDGAELVEYLWRRGRYGQQGAAPRPDIILLDLNMPVKNGRQLLAEIKSDSELRQIPVIVLTTSSDRADIALSYALGASSYLVKPATYERLVEMMRLLADYWGATVELPGEAG
jgi:CheY-like chemotaxis protein